MDVVIIGAGGHGKVVLDILRAAGRDKVVGFLDADTSLTGNSVGGLPVLGAPNLIPRLRQQKVRGGIVAIGDNRARLQYAAMLAEHGLELISAIHPTAHVSPTASLGAHLVIAAQATICVDARIGASVIVNTGAIVDHECIVEEGVHLCPGVRLAGRVHVERGAFVGLGANVIQCMTIGAEAIVGAGAVVIEDVPAGATAVGVPARVIKSSTTQCV